MSRRAPRWRQGSVLTASTLTLGLAGALCIGLALTQQQHAPQPPLSVLSGSEAVQSVSTGTLAAPRGGERPTLRVSPPIVLDIPAIGVHSRLQSLGQDADGAMEVPAPGPRYDDAGWYRYSPAPGSLGPAVIAGHVDSAHGGPSVFFRLGGLHVGDEVAVTRVDGSVAVFAVDDVRRYPKSRFPSALVYGNTDYAGLRLITCGGVFDRSTGHYADNVVVMASLVGSRVTPAAVRIDGAPG